MEVGRERDDDGVREEMVFCGGCPCWRVLLEVEELEVERRSVVVVCC